MAATLSGAVIVCVLQLASNPAVAIAGAAFGSAMLTTALTVRETPGPQAPWLKRAFYLLTFGLSNAMEAIEDLARSTRFL